MCTLREYCISGVRNLQKSTGEIAFSKCSPLPSLNPLKEYITCLQPISALNLLVETGGANNIMRNYFIYLKFYAKKSDIISTFLMRSLDPKRIK